MGSKLAMLQIWLSTLILTPIIIVKGSQCSSVLHYGDCEGLKLKKIPQNLPDSITILDLNDNLLESLSRGDLQRYAALDTLLINHNRLEAIDFQAFLRLTELCYLDLSYNNLKYISNDIFSNNTKLTDVFLSGNKFVFTPASPFLISSSITNLELRDCGIEKIPSNTFIKMEELSCLDLLRNRVMDLDSTSIVNTKMKDLYIDSSSGIENTLTKLCTNGTFVHFMMGNRLIDYCMSNLPDFEEKMTTFENTLRTPKSSSPVILRSTASSLSPMETTTFLLETEPTISVKVNIVTAFLSSPVVIPVKTNISKLEMKNDKNLEKFEHDHKIDTNVNKTLTISFDPKLLLFIMFLLLMLFSALTLMQWLHYNRKLQRNMRNDSQYALNNITASGGPTNPSFECLLLMDGKVSQNDGVRPIQQLVLPGRPLPSPPPSSRSSLLSYHKYDKLLFH